MNSRQKNYLITILLLSLAGLLGSLYFSFFGDPLNNLWLGELFNYRNHLAPCDLCWYARILLYPIVLISGVALWKKDMTAAQYYILPLAALGTLLEIYHYAIQKFSFPVLTPCSSTTPCTTIQLEYFGFVTIPFMGLIAFGAIVALALLFTREKS